MGYRGGTARWAAPLAAAVALLAGMAVTPAQAGPRHASGGWQSYLEQPRTSYVQAASATVVSGSVRNARALTSRGHGDATLTVTSADQPATVLLDDGVEVEGTPYLRVTSPGGTGTSVSLAFTEAKTYLTNAAGAVTGDSAFQPRKVSLAVTAAGTVSSGFMGGFRFEAITLTTPGTLVLHGAGVRFAGGYLARPSDYQGYFLSSPRSSTAPSATGRSGPAISRSRARASPTPSGPMATTT